MKIVSVLFTIIVAVGCTHQGRPEANARAQSQAAGAEADLAAALSGRVAGPPQDCVSEADMGGNKAYGTDVILFTGGTGEVVYVNRPAGGCPGLNFGRALKARTPMTRLCRGDIVTVFDPASGVAYGSCSLGEFTPYRRVR